MNTVEKWGVFEVELQGKSDGNPFVDYQIKGTFTGEQETITVDGFYDGDGTYRVRFMPSFEGAYTYTVSGNCTDEVKTGTFTVTAPSANNHGPMRVRNQFHFAYEDGTAYHPCGTTCYVWNLQSEELQKKTLKTLGKGYFNKMRFCVWPKHYIHNFHEPMSYPFEGTPCDSSNLTEENFDYSSIYEDNDWDFMRPNPAHYRHVETCIQQLGDLGIEADLIVMHPYDRWGFSQMPAEADDLYWNYIVARFAAYRNVWWSLANEYDLFAKKTTADWERYASIIVEKDPYRHLRSIHNCRPFYDYSRPWITHCSMQRQDLYRTTENTDIWRETYQKPVVLDEIAYEGNIDQGWGNISGEELTRRYWEAFVRGGYPQHGETYVCPEDILWWSHGGDLHGTSPERILFLRKIMAETPGPGLAPHPVFWDAMSGVPDDMLIAQETGYQIFYFGFAKPSFRDFQFDADTEYKVEVIDTWNMTITDAGVHHGKFRIALPGKEFMAVRVQKQYHK